MGPAIDVIFGHFPIDDSGAKDCHFNRSELLIVAVFEPSDCLEKSFKALSLVTVEPPLVSNERQDGLRNQNILYHLPTDFFETRIIEHTSSIGRL